MLRVRALSLSLAASVIVLVACGGSDDSTSPCVGAAKVADDCNAKENTMDYVFDEKRCEAAGDDGAKSASCINDHSDKCDCITTCNFKQSCP